MTRIVGVHGVGNYRPGIPPQQVAEHLRITWTRHLTGSPTNSPSGVDLCIAYYAPYLHPPGQQGTPDDPTELDPMAQAMALIWIAQLGLPQEVAQGPGTAPLRQAISWVAERFGLDYGLVTRFVCVFFAEVHTYLHNTAAAHDTSVRDGARAAVADAIAAHCPDVLLAHSLGSVVAYETLWAYPDLEVELLVTLGSPLGMPDVVFDRLHPAPSGGYGSRPPGVHKWVNIADRGDLVAIPRDLGRWFTGLRDREASIHWFDFHRVANYLACAATRDELASYRK